MPALKIKQWRTEVSQIFGDRNAFIVMLLDVEDEILAWLIVEAVWAKSKAPDEPVKTSLRRGLRKWT